MASLALTIPRYIYLTLHIYFLRSLLLALSAVDWVIEITLRVISALTALATQQESGGHFASRHYSKGRTVGAEDSEESVSGDSDGTDETLDSSEVYAYENAACLFEHPDGDHTLGLDLEYLIGALAEGIQSFAHGEQFFVQTDSAGSSARSSSSSISLLGSASAQDPDVREYSAVMRPHSPKRFSLRIDDLSMGFCKYPKFDPVTNFRTAENDLDVDRHSRAMALSRRDRLTLSAITLSTETTNANGDEDVPLGPALLWASSPAKVKVVLALPLKRTRRRRVSSVVIWSNEGGYGDLKNVLEEVGR